MCGQCLRALHLHPLALLHPRPYSIRPAVINFNYVTDEIHANPAARAASDSMSGWRGRCDVTDRCLSFPELITI